MRLVTIGLMLLLLLLVLHTTDAKADTWRGHTITHKQAVAAKVIRLTWNPYGAQARRRALSVSWCESKFNINAKNGQHWGLYQVSAALRSDYPGYGSGAWRQAAHALRVWNASGKDWDTHWRWSKGCWG